MAKQKKTTLIVDADLTGWLSFAGQTKATSVNRYVNGLILADRDRTIDEGGDDARRYRSYLEALGMTEELGYVDTPRAEPPTMPTAEEQAATVARLDAAAAARSKAGE